MPIVAEKLSGARENIDAATPAPKEQPASGVLRILKLFNEIQKGFTANEADSAHLNAMEGMSVLAGRVDSALQKIEDLTAEWTAHNPLNLSDEEDGEDAVVHK